MIKYTTHFLLTFTSSLLFCYCNAQKRVIDTSVYESWPRIDHFELSNNGNYVKYQVGNIPVGSFSTIIQSTQSDWNDTLVSQLCQFTDKGTSYVFKRGDDLVIKDLGKSNDRFVIKKISTYELLSSHNAGDWILYGYKDSPDSLYIKHLQSEKQISYKTSSYIRSSDKEYLIFPTKTEGSQLQFHLLSLRNQTDKVIWTGVKITQAQFSKSGGDVVFIGLDSSSSISIWHYKEGMMHSISLRDPFNKILSNKYSIGSLLAINSNGKRIFISLNVNEKVKPTNGVDVWSHHDVYLQSEQLISLQKTQPSVTAVIDLEVQSVELLEKDGFRLSSSILEAAKNNSDFILAEKFNDERTSVGTSESNWNIDQRRSTYLISLRDYSSRKIRNIRNYSGHRYCVLSPSGKFVVYFDPNVLSYFCMATSTGKELELTKNILGRWTSFYWSESIERSKSPERIACWAQDETEVYIYDQNDIYAFDPTGVHNPRNLTNEYGRRHNIVFRFVERSSYIHFRHKTVLVSGFNRENKKDGFYRIFKEGGINPNILTSQDALFIGEPVSENFGPYTNAVVKAQDAEAYIVQRMTAAESPNLFFSKDFKRFKRLSDVTPEKHFNWLTTQLFSWNMSDGTVSQGIIYKPENFDPTKKYPVIFQYYQRNSEGLNAYLRPHWSEATIDIPTYVSNGYVVVVPDIHYVIGNTGKSALGCVESAAKYLIAQFPWIDTNRLGLNGHSFGGMQTNYIIANSTMFAAAVSACGWADQISMYNSINNLSLGISRHRGAEGNHMNLGATLWERPDVYIENSPILKANHVKTPLLMMNNMNDNDIEFMIGGVEFFTALRRNGKIVWMLQYDGEGHILGHTHYAKRDFTIRTQQFFDHYLKGQPAPLWMTAGIAAKDKGKVFGYQIDTLNACSEKCNVCNSRGLKSIRVLTR